MEKFIKQPMHSPIVDLDAPMEQKMEFLKGMCPEQGVYYADDVCTGVLNWTFQNMSIESNGYSPITALTVEGEKVLDVAIAEFEKAKKACGTYFDSSTVNRITTAVCSAISNTVTPVEPINLQVIPTPDTYALVPAQNNQYNNLPMQKNVPALPLQSNIPQTNAITPSVVRDTKTKINPDILSKEFVRCCDVIRIKKAIYVYNQKNWVLTDDDQLRMLIMKHCRAMVEAVGFPDVITKAIQFLHDMPELEVDDLKINNYLISFDNYIYNIQDNKCYPHTRSVFIDKSLNIPYDSTAVACPHFEAYINALGNNNPQIIQLLWSATGYLISNLWFKHFFVLVGSGDTGKSLYGQIISSFFDKNNVSCLELQQIGDKFLTSELADKAINLNMDLPCSIINNAAISKIKQLTGGDTLLVDKKYCAAFKMEPRCKLLFASNHKIRLEYNDHEFYNRLVLIPCNNPIPKERQNHHLLDLIQPEKPAIAVKALKALREGIQSGCLFETELYNSIEQNMLVEVQSYADDDENMTCFITGRCLIEPNNKSLFTATSDLFSAFCNFCNETGRTSNLNDNIGKFSRKLNSVCSGAMLSKKRCGNDNTPINGYKFIKLK